MRKLSVNDAIRLRSSATGSSAFFSAAASSASLILARSWMAASFYPCAACVFTGVLPVIVQSFSSRSRTPSPVTAEMATNGMPAAAQ